MAKSTRKKRRWVRLNGQFTFQDVDRSPVTRQRRGDTPSLPTNYLDRCRKVSGGALITIPKSKRDRVAAAFADCLEGAIEDDGTWSALAEVSPNLCRAGSQVVSQLRPS